MGVIFRFFNSLWKYSILKIVKLHAEGLIIKTLEFKVHGAVKGLSETQ